MQSKRCEWCDSSFETKISYQIYCSADCREQATKEKIAQRYEITRRQRRRNRPRYCKSCNTKLSIYNDEELCDKCIVTPKEVRAALRDIKKLSKEEDNG